jgi:hypothetical protein
LYGEDMKRLHNAATQIGKCRESFDRCTWGM